MSMNRAVLCLCIGVLTMAGSTSGAQEPEGADRAVTLMFSSEPMDPSTGISLTVYWVADDFEVASTAEATTVTFKLGDSFGNVPTGFDGLIRWSIHIDSGFKTDQATAAGPPIKSAGAVEAASRFGGEPGPLVARGSAIDVNYSITTPSNWVFEDYYHVTFNLGQQVRLEAETHYWLVLHVNQGESSGESYSWIASGSSFLSPACYYAGTPTCTPTTDDLTFSVIANSEVRYLFTDGFEGGDATMWSSSAP